MYTVHAEASNAYTTPTTLEDTKINYLYPGKRSEPKMPSLERTRWFFAGLLGALSAVAVVATYTKDGGGKLIHLRKLPERRG